MDRAPVNATRTVEIRPLTLVPGREAELIRVYEGQCLPLLRRFGMDVVAFGLSLEAGHAYVIRAFDSPEHRQQSEDAFYGSPQWREGPRGALLACIERYVDAVFNLEAQALEGLRTSRGTLD